MKISDSKIIITGAGSGFGREMALFFIKNKAEVFALDINEESLKNLKQENSVIKTFVCDVSNNDEVEKIFDNIFINQNKTNILVNNAGIMKNAPLVNLLKRPDSRHSVELWQKTIDVNLNSVFYTTRSFASNMIKCRNNGVIVNISSISAKGNIGQTAYSASKAGVDAMTKVWAKELGIFGIRSVAIAPGFMDTSGTHVALEEKMLENWIKQTPLKRVGKIDEVVSAVKFVIENDFVNGEIININGGLKI